MNWPVTESKSLTRPSLPPVTRNFGLHCKQVTELHRCQRVKAEGSERRHACRERTACVRIRASKG